MSHRSKTNIATQSRKEWDFIDKEDVNGFVQIQQILWNRDKTFNLDRVCSFVHGLAFEGCNVWPPNFLSYLCISESNWTVFYAVRSKYPFEIWNRWMGKTFIEPSS